MSGAAACELCGRPTFDPGKRDRPWVRGVSAGRQVLICPACQDEREGWADSLDHCQRCESTRLGAMLGAVVCRACGHVAELAAWTMEEDEMSARADAGADEGA